MTEFLNKVVSNSEPWKMVPDSEENILRDLAEHTLDPVFEFYGNFVNRNPQWQDPDAAEKYAGCATIFGNFLTYSHAFRGVTDDAALIEKITAAVEKNKTRPEYQSALAERIANLPILTKENAKVGNYYAFGSGWLKVTRVYRLTDGEAIENDLYYIDRFEGITRNGQTVSAALPGGLCVKKGAPI